jgi:hypothetical protein
MNSKFGDFLIRAGPNQSNFDKFRQNAPKLLTLHEAHGVDRLDWGAWAHSWRAEPIGVVGGQNHKND